MAGKGFFIVAIMAIAALVGESEAQFAPPMPYPHPFPGYPFPPYPHPYPPMPFPHPGGCMCPMVYDPVCGIDGRTYGNMCQLQCSGMPMAHYGPCYFNHMMMG